MKDEKGVYTFSDNRDQYGHYIKHYYKPDELADVNRVRQLCSKRLIPSLNGYCMSTGCSCGDETKPICGLFKSYEADGVKRDFINQMFGI